MSESQANLHKKFWLKFNEGNFLGNYYWTHGHMDRAGHGPQSPAPRPVIAVALGLSPASPGSSAWPRKCLNLTLNKCYLDENCWNWRSVLAAALGPEMFLTKPNPEIILNKYFFVVEMVDIWVMYKIDKRGRRQGYKKRSLGQTLYGSVWM